MGAILSKLPIDFIALELYSNGVLILSQPAERSFSMRVFSHPAPTSYFRFLTVRFAGRFERGLSG